MMTDALETFYQLKEAGQVNNLEFFVVIYALTNLNQSDPYNKIITRVEALLSSLDSELTQWHIDEESDKDTKDYKVTVKHRFDVSSTVWQDVYPFNLSKKLYQLETGEYVKASCGGEHIYDTWDEQKDNEFWKIDNPQEEKIKAEEEFECSEAYSRGYNIMATYCSYAPSDQGHFWLRGSGFVHTDSSAKGSYSSSLANQYNWCGIYQKGTITSWDGDSYCYEAHVYWSKEPVKNRNNQKTSWKASSKSMKIENHDNNESYFSN